MAVCDICNAPGVGTLIGAEDMRRAVFKKSFNPFALGLNQKPAGYYEMWKKTIVAQDTSDWNLCSTCMSKLRPYLAGTPKPTGVTESMVSLNAPEKKWWQFWK
jgi:hypothetical protein